MTANGSTAQEFPRVSVVIPYFNASATIERAVQSVLDQTVPPVELIVVDDCSDAHEAAALRRLETLSNTVTVIRHEHNGGPGQARNTGWNHAVGDWVAFLDSDDSWLPTKLELQLKAAEGAESETALIASHVTLAADDAPDVKPVFQPAALQELRPRQLLFHNAIRTSSVMIRNDLAERFPMDQRYSEDFSLWLTVAFNDGGVFLYEQPLVVYFKSFYGDAGLSSNLVRMEIGELQTFWRLYRAQKISALDLGAAASYSLLKFGLRCGSTLFRRTKRLLTRRMADHAG